MRALVIAAPFVFVVAVAAGMVAANWNVARQTAYAGRHRAGAAPAEPAGWRVAYEARIEHCRATEQLATPVTIAERARLAEVLREDTASMFLPDDWYDIGSGADARGARIYANLSTRRLDAEAEYLRTHLGVTWPRSPFDTPLEPDEWTPAGSLVGAAS